MHLVIAMMKHETNTFSPLVTDWERFKQWGAYQGDAVEIAYGATRMPVAAYMRLATERGARYVTPLAAEAMPSGPVLKRTYDDMCDLICDAVANGCDGVLLDLHGAMVAEHTPDGEGTLLARIRDINATVPIAVTCDLHCNLTAQMIDNATAIIGYKTYPHVDKYEVAEQVGTIVLDAIDGRCSPVMAWGNVPLLSQTLCQGSDDEPMKSLIALCREAEEQPAILAATAFGGFPMADIHDAGNSAVIVADGDLEPARTWRDRILEQTWRSRHEFVYRAHPIEAAIEQAQSCDDGPIILLDHADNCGSGGTQDVMTAIKAVIDAGLEDVIVAAVCDPQAVSEMQRVGVGNITDVALGGNTDMPSINEVGKPLRLRGRVKALTDGKWIVRGPMYHGIEVDLGPTAVLESGGATIVVVSHHHEPWDTGVFTSVGIQPQYHRYIVLKSRIHYRAGFAGLARHTLTLDGTGVTTSSNAVLKYRHVRRPIYPLDEAEWQPPVA